MSHGWAKSAFRSSLVAVCLIGNCAFAAGGLASAPECVGEGALLTQTWESVTLPIAPEEAEIPLGEWRLPISSTRPDVLTEARLALRLVRGSGPSVSWRAEGDITFNDPKPFGIPFTFQTLVLEWEDGGERESAMLDWSEGCQSPGRSIFPRQSWSFTIDLKQTVRMKSLEHLTLGLWGSRN